ncbi:MAG: hypothetical protein AAF937_01275 [Planctomycetota bacterium]
MAGVQHTSLFGSLGLPAVVDDPVVQQKGLVPTAIQDRTEDGRFPVSACEIRWDAEAANGGDYVLGDEIDIKLEMVPRPLVVSDHLNTVMCRIEARVPDPSWHKRGYTRHLVVALWPYTLGWMDLVPFRGNHPSAKRGYKPDQIDAFNVGMLPDVRTLEDAIAKLDGLAYDPYLYSTQYSVAGKFCFRPFFPSAKRPIFYREPLKSGDELSWVLGLADDPQRIEGWLFEHRLEEVVEAAANPHKNGKTGVWSQSERDVLRESAYEVAVVAIRAAMAGYRKAQHREAAERDGQAGRVIDYACRIAREIGQKYSSIA